MGIRNKSLAKTIGLIVLAVLLLAGGGIYLYVQSVFDKIQVIDTESEVQIPSEYVKFLAAMDDDAEDSDKYTEQKDSIGDVGSGPSSAKASNHP